MFVVARLLVNSLDILQGGSEITFRGRDCPSGGEIAARVDFGEYDIKLAIWIQTDFKI